jgi:hypothetical protein
MYRYAKALALNNRLDEARAMFRMIGHVHGQVSYRRYKEALHLQIVEGEVALIPLEKSLQSD